MNRVEIGIDDEKKSLRLGECLTSGSTYRVVIRDGAESVGQGELIVLLPESYEHLLPRSMRECTPVVAARASLMAGTESEEGMSVGILSTNTDVLQTLAASRLVDVSLPCFVHSSQNAENVAVGTVRIRLVPIASGEPTGAAVLYRGERGVGIRRVEQLDFDDDGNRLFKIVLSDGREEILVAPHGKQGAPGLDAAVGYVYCEDGKWHRVVGRTDDEGVYVLDIGDETRDDSPWDEFASRIEGLADAAADACRIAEEKAGDAAESAEAAGLAARTASEKAGAAQQYMTEAARDAESAAASEASSRESAERARTSAEAAAKTFPLLTILPFCYGDAEDCVGLSEDRWLRSDDYQDAFGKVDELFQSGTMSKVYPTALRLEGEDQDPGEQLVKWHTGEDEYVGGKKTWLSGLDFRTSETTSFSFSTEFIHDGSSSTEQRPLLFAKSLNNSGMLKCTVARYGTSDRIGLQVTSAAGGSVLNVVQAIAISNKLDSGGQYKLSVSFLDGIYSIVLSKYVDGFYSQVGNYTSSKVAGVALDVASIGGEADVNECYGGRILIGKTTLVVNGETRFDAGTDQVLNYEKATFANGPDIICYSGSIDVRTMRGPYFVLVDTGEDMGFKVPYVPSGESVDGAGLKTEYMCRIR